MTSQSCIIIGEDNIALTCLHFLQEKGFHIKAAFSNTAEIRSLCEESFIASFPRRTCIENVVKGKTFDYLFSINNPTILSPAVLSLANKCSINYHDSLLPSYAGVHATSWAIINGEKKHGISWHLVETGIDTGDILQSQSVEIHNDDSAFSLNMKCMEAANLAFQRLISDLLAGKLHQTAQDFTQRSYYGLYECPPHLGILNFKEGLHRTYNLTRALEFGAHDNRLGSPKIYSPAGKFLLVTNARVLDLKNPPISDIQFKQGLILECQDNTLQVVTKQGILSLTVSALDGRNIVAEDLEKYCMKKGIQLPAAVESSSEVMALLPKKEQFWRQTMKLYDPTKLFIQKFKIDASALENNESDIETVDIPLPKLVLPEGQDASDDFLAASFVAFISRASCASSVHMGLTANTENITPVYLPLYADVCPCVINLDLSASVLDAMKHCAQILIRHKEAKTFLIDMFYRYPELRRVRRTPHHNLVIGFENDQLDDKRKKAILSDSNLLVVIGQQHISVSYVVKPDINHLHVIDLLRHFWTFLNSVRLNDNSCTLLDVSLISPEEAKILYQQSGLQAVEQYQDIIGIFRQVCASQTEAIAIKTTESKITYTQLLEEVCSLASMISTNLPQTYRTDLRCIALHIPNSVAYVVSMLSAMMCNNPFMPLPENTPIERMAFMLKDSKITVMLTTEDVLKSGKLKNLSSSLEILFDTQTSFGPMVMVLLELNDGDKMTSQSTNGLPEVYSFTNLSDLDDDDSNNIVLEPDCCYVMYTSGSTGRPKGVQVKFSGVFNMAKAQVDYWDINQTDTIAQFASIGFDATISEIFTAVMSGACLAVLMENERLGREFTDAMFKLQVTTITLPPSLLHIYGPNDFPSLRKVITAGEACALSTALRWKENSNVRFFNAYGPTETTVCATMYEFCLNEYKLIPSIDLPIGKPIHGVQVYLFDDFFQPVPPGVIGEIYIGGQGLSAGYIGHASKKNEERFVQNPFDTNSKLYKTGDHAIQDKDGCLTYIGRLDDQVKIRGQRIDLNEIEQIILQHPKVDMAVVVKHQSKTSPDASIAAFVAPTNVFPYELREFLGRALPGYMMPTHIKNMNATDFPLTLNGKIDRKKLKRDQSVIDNSVRMCPSHLTPPQLSIAKLWCRVLQMDETYAVNMHSLSSFTGFGGNSLHMILLQRSIEEEFGILLSFTEIGGASNIEDFVDLIKHKEESQSSPNDMQLHLNLKQQLIKDSILDMQKLNYLAGPQTLQREMGCDPGNILLSGSTGFLGAFLLYEILIQSEARVYCMVREATEQRGYGRIVTNMQKYKLWENGFKSRINVVLSDISKPNLGLAPDIYDSLSISIDVVFMNAAKMNFNTDYFDHKKANVDGTFEFIKFATMGKRKFLFATSSLAVFLFPPNLTQDEHKPPDNSVNGHGCTSNNGKTLQKRIASHDNEAQNDKDNIRNGCELTSTNPNVKPEQMKTRESILDNKEHKELKGKSSFLDKVPKKMTSFYSKEGDSIYNTVKFNRPMLIKTNGSSFASDGGKIKIRSICGESDEIKDPSLIVGGYGQSKWVSERLVLQALDHLPGGAVFRPARVSGHSKSGIGPTDDLFARLVKGIKQLGFAPDLDFPFDLTPVNYCAGGMVEVMLQVCQRKHGKMPYMYHFFNHSTIQFLDLFEGSSVKHVPLKEWRERVKQADRENPLIPLTPFILSSFWDRSPDWPIFSTQNTDRFVSLGCRRRQFPSRSLLKVYKQFFKQNMSI